MAAQTADEPGPGRLRRFGPVALGILAAQILIAWIFVKVLMAPHGAAGKDDELLAQPAMRQAAVAAPEERRLPHYYAPVAFRRILVNPANTNAQRYLIASIELGLKSYDRSKTPPKDDVTKKLGADTESLAILDRYANKMRSIMGEALARQGMAALDRRDLISVQAEIRQRINQEVLRPAFPPGKAKREIVVVEVMFTELVVQ